LRIKPELISRIKEAQKEDSEIWTIVENLGKQVEFYLDDDNVLWQNTSDRIRQRSTFHVSFLEGLQKAWGTRLKFSTAFHPQTDGQSERTLQILEDMLRSCALEWTGNGMIISA
nr:hypothetical protein [Tanacetum cinerariifolium]